MTLRILLLTDERPGHYHLSEGVVAALSRLAEVDCTPLRTRRNRLIPMRVFRALMARGLGHPGLLLALGYGLAARRLPKADLVVSAGGETMVANVAAATHLGAENIFCGSLRKMAPEHFSLVISSYARHAGLPRHVVALKPNCMDPDALAPPDALAHTALARPAQLPRFGSDNPPRLAGLLIGGDSGLFHYQEADWNALLAFVRALSEAWGTKWLISTSRRTAGAVADRVAALAAEPGIVEAFVDYRTAGPGTLPDILGRCDIIVCTEDSSTMISEAVSARLPVIGVSPARHAFKPEEAEYRAFMAGKSWCRFLPLRELDGPRFAAALKEIRPMAENHLDNLARILRDRLPGLFAATPS